MDELIQNLLKLQTLEISGPKDGNTAAQVAELRGKIPPQVLGHYDRFLVRGKKALVVVNNQVCTGCHMRLPLAVMMKLRHREDIQLCDSCGRYLYLLVEPELKPINTSSAAKPARSARRREKPKVIPENVADEASVVPTPEVQPRISPE